jgi:hypothetical protein
MEYLLNSSLETLSFEMKNMEKLAYQYEKEPEKFPTL